MEVYYIFSISPLHGDSKGLERVEGECNQASDSVIDRPAQESRLDLELQEARISGVEPAENTERQVTTKDQEPVIYHVIARRWTDSRIKPLQSTSRGARP